MCRNKEDESYDDYHDEDDGNDKEGGSNDYENEDDDIDDEDGGDDDDEDEDNGKYLDHVTGKCTFIITSERIFCRSLNIQSVVES